MGILNREMLDVAYMSVFNYCTTLDLMSLAYTVGVATVTHHALPRTSTVV